MFSENLLIEQCRKITVDELVRTAQRMLKTSLIQSQIEALGIPVTLATSKTRYNGERIWFVCPSCKKRAQKLFQTVAGETGCRICLGLKYKRRRYKGMIEAKI